jgi:hypothetical protein
MRSCVFAGCSYVSGHGFVDGKSDPNIWPNIIHRESALSEFELVNVSESASSNARIFAECARAMTTLDCAVVFVSWTSMPRYEMDLGLELYSTRQSFIPNSPVGTHKLNSGVVPESYLENIKNRWVSLPHLHREIWWLVHYLNTLNALANLTQTQIFFVNGLCPWDDEYFTVKSYEFPNDLSNFTKNLIGIDNRSDEEINKLYKLIHEEYQSLGGIQDKLWLNLYDSIRDNLKDFAIDGIHPGPKTNRKIANKFLPLISI